ncbi:hypothetical protein Fcan01_23426 [Folsomia candida]|uniref:Uncharacterized protein n=1 Tax=Folsomia candida TaxID=158441 RepID=A0A226D8Z6_FOLCA|nr:hypothetical protein Fcan01_23426 [Folsomia candida]
MDDDMIEDLAAADAKSIDINRLVYTPKPLKSEKLVDRTSGWVDYWLVLVNFCSLILAMYHLLIGMTILSFSSSIQSILDESGSDQVAVLHTVKDSSPSTISLVLIGSAFFQIINAVGGVYGCLQGVKDMLIIHLVCAFLLLFGEIVFSALTCKSAYCSLDDIRKLQDQILEFIRIHGTEAPQGAEKLLAYETAIYQLDSIQIGLSCCGAIGWADYINPVILQDGNKSAPIPIHVDLDGVETHHVVVLGVHLWAHPAVDDVTATKFRQRINQAGCMWRIFNGCKRIRGLVTIGLVIVTVIDFFLVGIKIYCAYSIVKNIYDIIRKKKEIIASDIGADVDEELEEGVDRRPLPTEDEIELIKARSDFNKFEARSKKTARVKRTQIGRWMKQARKSVYLTFSKTQAASVPRRLSIVDMRRKSLTGYIGKTHSDNSKMGEDPDEEQFLDAEAVLKLEIQKQMRKQDERRLREMKTPDLSHLKLTKAQLEKREKEKRKSKHWMMKANEMSSSTNK